MMSFRSLDTRSTELNAQIVQPACDGLNGVRDNNERRSPILYPPNAAVIGWLSTPVQCRGLADIPLRSSSHLLRSPLAPHVTLLLSAYARYDLMGWRGQKKTCATLASPTPRVSPEAIGSLGCLVHFQTRNNIPMMVKYSSSRRPGRSTSYRRRISNVSVGTNVTR